VKLVAILILGGLKSSLAVRCEQRVESWRHSVPMLVSSTILVLLLLLRIVV
jgi:hypothetical protein